MNPVRTYLSLVGFFLPFLSVAQLMEAKNRFTRDDTLRGTITEYRKGWDVLKYDLTVEPDAVTKTLVGKNTITYYESRGVQPMEIDLQQPWVGNSIFDDGATRRTFKRDNNVCFIYLRDSLAKYKFLPGIRKLT